MSRQTILASTAVAICVALFVDAPTAEAATRYAGPTGTGAEPCAIQADPCNIEDAVGGGTVMPGDDVVLLPGNYTLGSGGLYIGENISETDNPGNASAQSNTS